MRTGTFFPVLAEYSQAFDSVDKRNQEIHEDNINLNVRLADIINEFFPFLKIVTFAPELLRRVS